MGDVFMDVHGKAHEDVVGSVGDGAAASALAAFAGEAEEVLDILAEAGGDGGDGHGDGTGGDGGDGHEDVPLDPLDAMRDLGPALDLLEAGAFERPEDKAVSGVVPLDFGPLPEQGEDEDSDTADSEEHRRRAEEFVQKSIIDSPVVRQGLRTVAQVLANQETEVIADGQCSLVIHRFTDPGLPYDAIDYVAWTHSPRFLGRIFCGVRRHCRRLPRVRSFVAWVHSATRARASQIHPCRCPLQTITFALDGTPLGPCKQLPGLHRGAKPCHLGS